MADAHEFTLTILTPDKCFLSQTVQEVIFDTTDGRVGIMAGHMLMIAAVVECTVEINVGGEWRMAAVSQGFAEITGDTVELFVDTVEWGEEIDAIRAREAYERAKSRLDSKLSHTEYLNTQSAMARALARIKASGS